MKISEEELDRGENEGALFEAEAADYWADFKKNAKRWIEMLEEKRPSVSNALCAAYIGLGEAQRICMSKDPDELNCALITLARFAVNEIRGGAK